MEGDEVSAVQLGDIEKYLHEKIPLTQAMGVHVESYEDGQFIITAPIDRNHNHLNTAFGGSLSAMATLAGYGFLWLELNDPAVHVVIKDSAMKFLRPVLGEIRAICRAPGGEMLEQFKRDFARKGKARILLKSRIVEDDSTAMEFEGTFVALRDR